MKTKPCWIGLFTLLGAVVAPGFLRGDVINGSLEVSQGLTVRGDALLEGVTSFGKLPSQSTAGYSTDVFQGTSTVEREEVIPDHYEWQTVYVDVYGTIFGSTWVDDWGWVNRDVWVPDQYDGEGNISASGYWSTQSFWEVTGGHSESTSYWGVIGTDPSSVQVWVPEQRTSYTETVYGIPVVRHTGQRHDVVWSWRNANTGTGVHRELMELSPAGLSLPHPDVTDGSVRAVLTSTQFEQSFTTPATAPGSYQSYGSKVLKDKIVAWFDEGTITANTADPNQTMHDVTLTSSRTTQVKPEEILIQDSQPAADGLTSTTVTTRVSAASSTFGGNVSVNGALLVQPQGDLTMGAYTNGPQP